MRRALAKSHLQILLQNFAANKAESRAKYLKSTEIIALYVIKTRGPTPECGEVAETLPIDRVPNVRLAEKSFDLTLF